MKKQALGRGLSALIDTDIKPDGGSSINEIEISKIHPNPNQPRTYFDEEALQELANSIHEMGIVSPITLRQLDDDTYQIIAGERRYRASKLAGLDKIPAYIKTNQDEQHVQLMALIENIQREDLNAIEIALTFYRLMEEYNLTQERLSERVGKKRTTIANYLRLLRLPAEIQMGIKDKKIDMGHARALLALSGQAQSELAKLVAQKGLTVRDTEKLVQKALEPAKTRVEPVRDPQFGYLERQISEKIGNQVQLQPGKKDSGKLVISYDNLADLDRVLGYFGLSES